MGYQSLITYDNEDRKQQNDSGTATTLVSVQKIPETVRVPVDITDPKLQAYVRQQVVRFCKEKGLQGEEEDMFEQVIIKAISGAFKGESSVKTWLYSIAHNECENERRHREKLVIQEPTENDPDPLSDLADIDSMSVEARMAIEWLRARFSEETLVRRILEAWLKDPALSRRGLAPLVGAEKSAIHVAIVKYLRPALSGLMFSQKPRAKQPIGIEGTRKAFRRGA